MEQKELVGKLVEAANVIHKKRKASAGYISVSTDFIQERADELGISFDEMLAVMKDELLPEK